MCVEIGLIGLVEEEWIVTLSTVDPDDVRYLDLVEEGRRLAQELKQQVIFSAVLLGFLEITGFQDPQT